MSREITCLSEVGETLQDLVEFLEAPPSTKARVNVNDFNSWTTVVPEKILRHYFKPITSGDSCAKLSIKITSLLFHPLPILGESEVGCHSRIDQCLTNPIHDCAPSFELRRNSSQKSSSYPLKRPDLSATLVGRGCFFRSEEKNIDSDEDSKRELYEKQEDVWLFPGLPYVLGYYSIGTMLTFCKVCKDNAQDASSPLELRDAASRLRCWNICRNVARIINFMAMHFETISPNDLRELTSGSTNGQDWVRTVSFSGGHVLKTIHPRDEHTQAKLNRLLDVFAEIKNGLQGLQPVLSCTLSLSVKDRSKRRRVPPRLYWLSTFGESIPKIADVVQLRKVVVFLLETIERIHNEGITHRDIQLPNVVWNKAEGGFGLIDWDDSVRGLKDLPNADVSHLNPASHAPEIFIEGGTHDRMLDLWSVGHIIQENVMHADNVLKLLKAALLKPANERPEPNAAIEMLSSTN